MKQCKFYVDANEINTITFGCNKLKSVVNILCGVFIHLVCMTTCECRALLQTLRECLYTRVPNIFVMVCVCVLICVCVCSRACVCAHMCVSGGYTFTLTQRTQFQGERVEEIRQLSSREYDVRSCTWSISQ